MVAINQKRVSPLNGMDRFSQLEFDEKGQPPKGRGEDVRNADYFLKVALKYWLAGDFEVALRNYSRVLEQDKTAFEGWIGQVMMLIELGEYKEALIWADKALSLFPEHPELLAAKAVACCRDAKMDKAAAYSDNSVSKEQITSRVWLARAEVMMSRKSQVAEGCISKAISTAGKTAPVVKLEAARLLRRRRRYSAAMGYLHELVQVVPKSALAWYELGVCQARLGLPQAKATLEQSLQLRPDWDAPKRALKKWGGRGLFGWFFKR
jgi:tetratricopeptide (TPR) repeat protein